MKPERYGNLNGDSGVRNYAIGPDFIAVQFLDPTVYVYNYGRPGRAHVDRMKELAAEGRGLGAYISRYVREEFASKQLSW
jgi:hypothetical protein